MTQQLPVDAPTLRAEIREKYREVAEDPNGEFHFHTGRKLATRMGYDRTVLDQLPEQAVESFAGVANPFSAGEIPRGARVVDIGSGGGFDSIVAGTLVGPKGQVIGVDMTPQMLERAQITADELEMSHVEFREGLAESLPVPDGWADVVISNGVLNLVADKQLAFSELFRITKPGGVVQFGDIANGRPVPEEAVANIDLWSA